MPDAGLITGFRMNARGFGGFSLWHFAALHNDHFDTLVCQAKYRLWIDLKQAI